jgi:hypothetical protein
MATSSAPASPITGEVMFYKNPEPLHVDLHGKLGLRPSASPFGFARTAQAVPLIVGEFGPASLSFPVVFAGADYQPLAVMGVRLNENLFVEPNGAFAPAVYVPAFIRRYPFVFAHGAEEDKLIVCIDRGADTLVEGGEVPLFVNGEPSPFTKQCMEFCSNFEAERRRTDDFVKLLRDLDLFELKTVNFTPRNFDGTPGETVKVSEHFGLSEEKIKALPDKTQLELLKSGAMQQIHHHWNSLLNWERLVTETSRRFPVAPLSQG